MKKIMCLHQLIKPDKHPIVYGTGKGECWKCKTDENNKYCVGYYPVTITIETVENE